MGMKNWARPTERRDVDQDKGLLELLDALRWRWRLAALITLGVVMGAVFYVQGLPSEYQAETVVALAPRAEAGAAADTVRVVAPKYVSFITAPQTIRAATIRIGVSPDALSESIDATLQPDSGNLTITATGRNPRLMAEAANLLAAEAVRLSTRDELLSAEVVAEATVPTVPSGPPRLLLEAAALAVGILAGVTISLLIERGRPRIRSWRDIPELTGYTTLARIPRVRILRFRPREAFSDPDVGAAFRTLRTNVERLSADREDVPIAKVISITSAVQGDGKTTVAALYAESLARLGTRTLLVDADLARGSVARTFELEVQQGGTAQVLRGTATLDEAVQKGWVDDLYVLTTERDPDAGDVLARELESMLQEIVGRYEAVIIDGPPLIGTDEGRTLATKVGSVIMVIRGGEMAGPVNEAVLALEDLKVPVIGAVANRMRRSDVGQPYR